MKDRDISHTGVR